MLAEDKLDSLAEGFEFEAVGLTEVVPGLTDFEDRVFFDDDLGVDGKLS